MYAVGGVGASGRVVSFTYISYLLAIATLRLALRGALQYNNWFVMPNYCIVLQYGKQRGEYKPPRAPATVLCNF